MIKDNYIKYMKISNEEGIRMIKPNKNKKLENLLSIEEITSDHLYNTINSILSFNKINSQIIKGSSKYNDFVSLLSKENNLEFVVSWIQTKNFKKWFTSYNEILINLSILNLEKTNLKIYDFDNNFYSGDLQNGKKIGKGKISYYEEKLTYVGEFKNNLREGKGNLSSKDNKYIYDGSWKNDKFEGEGSLLSPSLGKYTGNFKNGLFDGKGYLFTLDNNIYKGNFLAGEKSGEGEYKLKNGYVYEGEFKNDLYHGMGKLYDNNKKIIQEGKFQKGQLVKAIK